MMSDKLSISSTLRAFVPYTLYIAFVVLCIWCSISIISIMMSWCCQLRRKCGAVMSVENELPNAVRFRIIPLQTGMS